MSKGECKGKNLAPSATIGRSDPDALGVPTFQSSHFLMKDLLK